MDNQESIFYRSFACDVKESFRNVFLCCFLLSCLLARFNVALQLGSLYWLPRSTIVKVLPYLAMRIPVRQRVLIGAGPKGTNRTETMLPKLIRQNGLARAMQIPQTVVVLLPSLGATKVDTFLGL